MSRLRADKSTRKLRRFSCSGAMPGGSGRVLSLACRRKGAGSGQGFESVDIQEPAPACCVPARSIVCLRERGRWRCGVLTFLTQLAPPLPANAQRGSAATPIGNSSESTPIATQLPAPCETRSDLSTHLRFDMSTSTGAALEAKLQAATSIYTKLESGQSEPAGLPVEGPMTLSCPAALLQPAPTDKPTPASFRRLCPSSRGSATSRRAEDGERRRQEGVCVSVCLVRASLCPGNGPMTGPVNFVSAQPYVSREA